MAPRTSSDLISALQSSQRLFLAALNGLADSDALKRPGPGRWSVIDCIEHVCITERLGLKRLEAAELAEDAEPDAAREAACAAQVLDRGVKIEGPRITMPPGHHASLASALAEFTDRRKKTVEYVKGCATLARLRLTHPVFGALTGREYVLIIAGHSTRHAAQIGEIRAQMEMPG